MHSYLRQSTASQSRSIGPFLDDTDFKTAETGLTVANTDIKLVVNGGASADKNSGGGTHRANGVYGVTFDATDTATVGEMFVSVKVAGALPVFATFVVVEEAVYDMLFAASALGYINNAPVNVAQFGGSNGTFASGRPEVNTSHIAGSAVSTTTAQIGVNVVQISGDSTSADNLESYTDGTTPMPVNVTQLSGDATAADNSEAFFDGTGYAGTNNVIPTVTNLTNKGDGSGFTAIPWNAAWDAEVQSEVQDALDTAVAEPGQGNPGATISIVSKIGYLYKAWRNRTTQTASEYALYADDGTTKDQEAAISDNGTTLDRSEVQTGA